MRSHLRLGVENCQGLGRTLNRRDREEIRRGRRRSRNITSVKRREEWRPVLDAEITRWESKSCAQLISELKDVRAYETEFNSKKYQVEVQLLENTERYVHVGVAVDDASF